MAHIDACVDVRRPRLARIQKLQKQIEALSSGTAKLLEAKRLSSATIDSLQGSHVVQGSSSRRQLKGSLTRHCFCPLCLQIKRRVLCKETHRVHPAFGASVYTEGPKCISRAEKASIAHKVDVQWDFVQHQFSQHEDKVQCMLQAALRVRHFSNYC